ncbi:MAG: hypothetical protein GY839_06340 [candidate division Zixibacteria bacterium]|nr:hypothetical protein [candidate division Zixibacteria bacterium]
MIENNASKQVIITIALIMLFAFSNGITQTVNDDIDSIAYKNVVNMIVDAFNDNGISIALCKIPDHPWFNEMVPPRRDSAGTISVSPCDINITKTLVLNILRGRHNIDSLFYLYRVRTLLREGSENQFPFLSFYPGSEFILFLDSPFRNNSRQNTYITEKYEKLIGREFLNTDNFFSLYKLNAGALCIYCPEDAKLPPKFIYSKDLVDDFKTLIKLKKYPSPLRGSTDSYDIYSASMKDDLGKRVFSRMFAKPKQ